MGCLHSERFLCIVSSLVTVYVCISLPFYLLVIVVLIIRRKQLNSSFFNLCVSVGIADCLLLLVRTFLRIVLPTAVYSTDERNLITEIYESSQYQTFNSMVAGWSIYYCQISGIVVLTINRFSAIWNPLKFELLWRKRNFQLALLFQWFWLLPFSLPQLLPCCHSRMVDNQTTWPTFVDSRAHTFFWISGMLLETGIVVPFLIIAHILMFCKVMRYKRVRPGTISASYNMDGVQRKVAVEIRYAILGAILCLCYFSMTASAVSFFFGGNQAYLEVLGTVTGVIFTTANPWLLICFSSLFREQLINFVSRGKFIPKDKSKAGIAIRLEEN